MLAEIAIATVTTVLMVNTRTDEDGNEEPHDPWANFQPTQTADEPQAQTYEHNTFVIAPPVNTAQDDWLAFQRIMTAAAAAERNHRGQP